jgi:hypothetical protein
LIGGLLAVRIGMLLTLKSAPACAVRPETLHPPTGIACNTSAASDASTVSSFRGAVVSTTVNENPE